jgi:hypothetical protein
MPILSSQTTCSRRAAGGRVSQGTAQADNASVLLRPSGTLTQARLTRGTRDSPGQTQAARRRHEHWTGYGARALRPGHMQCRDASQLTRQTGRNNATDTTLRVVTLLPSGPARRNLRGAWESGDRRRTGPLGGNITILAVGRGSALTGIRQLYDSINEFVIPAGQSVAALRARDRRPPCLRAHPARSFCHRLVTRSRGGAG